MKKLTVLQKLTKPQIYKLRNYIKKLKYGKIGEYSPDKVTAVGNLAGYVKEKKCIDCKTKTIKFNRCKICYYGHRGWDISRLSHRVTALKRSNKNHAHNILKVLPQDSTIPLKRVSYTSVAQVQMGVSYINFKNEKVKNLISEEVLTAENPTVQSITY